MEELDFSELRKIQKSEARQDELSELGEKFLLRVSDFLDRKEGTDDREYRNSKRVFDKIISLREDKIVKNAKLAVKSEVKASQLNLLPREQELFRTLKDVFQEHRGDIDGEVNGDIEYDEEDFEDDGLEEAGGEESPEDGYEKLEITAHVSEFMGTDLETYGPFEEGDEVEVPEENAEILVNRGNAERVEG